MELSEVVSAHFAFPVVGVVLCAVLVFAFGFKSPGQPPSFDLLDDDDDRKYKKSRQKKHKLSIDGHVINIDGHGSPGAKVMTKQQVTLNRQATNEKQEPQVTKIKIKKPKPVADTGIINERLPEVNEDAEATGEWTKAVSKKDRKNKSKKDDGSKKDDLPVAAAASVERTSPSHEIQKAFHVTHPVVNSRDEVCSNRTQRRTLEVTVTAPAPAPVPVFVSCATVPAGSDSASINSDSFSGKVKAVVVSVTIASTIQSEPQKSAVTSREQTIKTSSQTSIPKPLLPTTGKFSEAAAANVVQLPVEVNTKVTSVSTAVIKGVKNSADGKTSEKWNDSSTAVTVGESKPAKSPKKKKKSPESREKYIESPVVTIPTNTTVSAVTVTAEPLPIVKPVNSNTPTKEIQMAATQSGNEIEASASCVQCSSLPADERSPDKTDPSVADNCLPFSNSKMTAGVAEPANYTQPVGDFQPASDNCSGDDSQPPALVDEIGDWQEAKPLKKKRKPQREN